MATVEVYAEATAGASLEAVGKSVEQFVTGKVERNNSFLPSAPEFAENAARWQQAIEQRDDPGEKLYNGLLEIDYGRGKINMRGLTAVEQDRVMALGGVAPNGFSFAGMSPEGIRSLLIDDGSDKIEGPRKAPLPRLKGMGDV